MLRAKLPSAVTGEYELLVQDGEQDRLILRLTGDEPSCELDEASVTELFNALEKWLTEQHIARGAQDKKGQ